MSTATPMNDHASGNKPGPDPGDDAAIRYGRRSEFARNAVPHRRCWKRGMVGMAVLLAVGATAGCNDIYPVLPVPPEAYVSKPGNTLAPGDEIRLVFSGAPDLNTQQKIQPSGNVSLPTIGEVTAAGRTVASLQEQLTTFYQPHLQDSTVTVSLAGTAAGVYVSGAVLRPGKIPLDRPLTVLEAVMESGGFDPMANPKQVVIVRTQDGKSKNYVLNLHQALHGTVSTPFYVRPYDVIYVNKSAW